MAVLHDKEFGDITIRRSKLSRNIKLSVAPNGTLRMSMPLYAPLFLARRLVASSRSSVRAMLEKEKPDVELHDGMQIGKSHSLHINTAAATRVEMHDRRIQVSLASSDELKSKHLQEKIREQVIKALRKEAKSYLPKRLAYLAQQHGFSYTSARFSHASSRWGSCSSNGTISLNIALMKLPFELVDYVILHELCHTKEMNHSRDFWSLVEACDPEYLSHRSALKKENPMIL